MKTNGDNNVGARGYAGSLASGGLRFACVAVWVTAFALGLDAQSSPPERNVVCPRPEDEGTRLIEEVSLKECAAWPLLAHGRWAVILRNAWCGHCGPTLEEYGGLAARWRSDGKPLRVAVLTVSEGASAFEPPQRSSPEAVLSGTLSNPRNVFLVSPTLLLLAEGRVVKMTEGALDCQWNAEKEALLTR